ncbi:TNT domain-containing protein [Nocardiopsis lambiniae]|uniref:TNT domain-containing protein n=1 Tax=Nocardiopsis lambiniae TaxID=3075539 RepID=A0ABU2MHI6_9ACTN|nr:TNT domain-containing protein [Nocardiopsis sp. DSM 44743]MDT0331706.1 TNT domain-containing protein [Nocardiopsis sp. DSM 44743]
MKSSLVVGVALTLLAVAAPAHAAPPPVPSEVPAGCPVLTPPPTAEDLERYLCGDRRLGPAELPDDGPVGGLLDGYERLGDLTPEAFLDRWWGPDGWEYPDHMGFEVVDGEPVTEVMTLPEGWMLDRFGSPWGTFLAPAGARYAERALPPDSLNTWPDGPEHNYSCYEVTTAFTALTGPIAPHFEQPGGGEQVLVPAEGLSEPVDGEYARVNELLELGHLEARPTEECVAFPGYALS